MPLSDTAIRKLRSQVHPYKVFDGGGLFLWVQPGGGKWWRFKYRFLGKEKLLALGSYPEVSLAEVRNRHFEARKTLAASQDPSELRQEGKRQALTKNKDNFETVAREWHERFLEKWTPDHAARLIKRLEANIFPKLGGRPIAAITSAEVLAVIQKVENRNALDLAHRLLQMLGQIFSYGVVTQRLERNPVTDLRGALKPVIKNNHAYLRENDLPEFFGRLERFDGHPQTGLAVRFLLLTFVRTGELRGAKWDEIDFSKGEWRIPAERMKMREAHIVPLSRQAINVLEKLKPLTAHWGNFLFPNQHKPSGCMSENTILFALYRMGYHSRATGHGFRATASTILNENGFDGDVIERQLAHGERNKIRAAYNHAQYLPERRNMMQWWADHLDLLATRTTSIAG